MKKALRRLKSFSLILLVVLLGLGVAGAFLSSFIKPIIANSLSEQLNVPVTMSNVRAGFFKHFPYYAVTLQDVNIPEYPRETGKPLLKARQVGISFNPFDLIQGDYTIKRFHITDGVAHVGFNNYHIFKSEEDSDSSQTASFQLSQVKMKRVRVVVHDGKKELEDWTIFDANSKWIVKSENVNFDVVGSMETQSPWLKEVPQLKGKNLQVELKGSIPASYHFISLETSMVKVENQAVFLKGRIDWNQEVLVDLEVEAPELKPKYIREWVPDVDWTSFGDPTLLSNVSAKGLFQMNPQNWLLDLSISGKETEMSLAEIEKPLRMNDWSAQAKVTNRSIRMELLIPEMWCEEEQTQVELNYTNSPSEMLSVRVEKRLPLKLLKPFLTGIDLRGVVDVEGVFLDMVVDKKGNFVVDDLAANVDLAGVEMLLDNRLYRFEQGKLISIGRNLELIRAVVNADEVIATGTLSLSDINYFLIPGLDASLNGECKLRGFKYVSESDGSDEEDAPDIEDNLMLDLKLRLEDCVYDEIAISKAHALVQMIPNQWALTGMEVEAFGGTIMGNLNGSTKQDELMIKGGVSFSQLDLKEVFRQMNNFGQDELTSSHVAGICKGDLEMTALWRNGEFISNRLKVVADLEVVNGQLTDYETLNSLSDFVDIDELKDVKFKRLKNTVTIDSGNIYIPKMNIFNTAMSLEVTGIHRFDNYVDYRFEVSLVEVLAKRAGWARKRKEKRFREERNGGLTAFISMIGPIDNPEISYDKKAFKKRVKENLKEEGKELKETFSGEATGDDGYSWDE